MNSKQPERGLGAETVAKNFGGSRRAGSGWVCCCPAHDDKTPSLSLRDRDDGGIVVYCHAGCSQDAVIAALEDREISVHPNNDQRSSEHKLEQRRKDGSDSDETARKAEWKPIVPVPDTAPAFTPPNGAQSWTYRDAGAKILMHVTRQNRDGSRKIILPWVFAADSYGRQAWRSMALPSPRPLYGLGHLAARPYAPVLVTEGEKAADAAAKRFVDYVAVTSPGGSKAATHADWSPLSGREVVIWPDNDGPGQSYADNVARLANAAGAASVRIVVPPSACASGWDLADVLPEGISDNDLHRVVADAEPWEPLPSDESSPDVLLYEARCLADVRPVPISWLWQDRLALGKLNLIAGQPGLGKSQLTALMAATVSVGGTWPDGSKCPKGDVIFVCAEDDAADTIVPRLNAVGADLERVHILDWVRDRTKQGEPYLRSLDIGRDADALRALAAKHDNVRLIVIDPVSAYLGKFDSHKTADVRVALAPLGALAAKIGACLILVSHLNKAADGAAITRVSGSGAFVAACRSAWLVAGHPDDEEQRVFTILKNNLGRDRICYAYHIEGVKLPDGITTSRVVLNGKAIDISPEEALSAERNNATDRSALGEAKDFLAEELKDGPKPVKEIEAAAEKAVVAWRTIQRAKPSLGIESKRSEFGGQWSWNLPPEG